MPISSHHPDYDEYILEWELCRHAYRGEEEIKDQGTRYLPMPGGFKAQPDKGLEMYSAYVNRAQFPEILQHTIGGMVGVIHRGEAHIEMPPAMEPLWERATPDNLPLEVLHRRITTELLKVGRYGLLVDVREGDAEPVIAGYIAESVINWDDDGSLVVVDETDYQRITDGYAWAEVPAWRALSVEEGRYTVRLFDNENAANEPINPTAQGGQALQEIPFVIANARDMRWEPEPAPLVGVARSARNIYQLSADYRWQLFMTGQETLFVIDGDAPAQVGAGVVVTLKGGDGLTPDAKYVGPAGTGISAHRTAILDERQAAAMAGAKLFETSGGGQESGEALKLRYAAETATLTTVAQTSAAALERALRYVAMMKGLDSQAVTVKPNLDFVDMRLSPQEAESLVRVWQEGAISYQTLYENLQAGQIASPERDHEAEGELIDSEEPNRLPPGPGESGFLAPQRGDAAQPGVSGDAVEGDS